MQNSQQPEQPKSVHSENDFVVCGQPAARPDHPAERWVPVSERLPERDGYVLMAASSGLVTSTFFCTEADFFRKETAPDAHSWKFEHGAKYGYAVTHWMPLPLAPVGQHRNAEAE